MLWPFPEECLGKGAIIGSSEREPAAGHVGLKVDFWVPSADRRTMVSRTEFRTGAGWKFGSAGAGVHPRREEKRSET